MNISDVQYNGENGYYLTADGKPHHLTGGEVEVVGECASCRAKEAYTTEGDVIVKLFSDESLTLCGACIQKKGART